MNGGGVVNGERGRLRPRVRPVKLRADEGIPSVFNHCAGAIPGYYSSQTSLPATQVATALPFIGQPKNGLLTDLLAD
jgi:hypothetical protein